MESESPKHDWVLPKDGDARCMSKGCSAQGTLKCHFYCFSPGENSVLRRTSANRCGFFDELHPLHLSSASVICPHGETAGSKVWIGSILISESSEDATNTSSSSSPDPWASSLIDCQSTLLHGPGSIMEKRLSLKLLLEKICLCKVPQIYFPERLVPSYTVVLGPHKYVPRTRTWAIREEGHSQTTLLQSKMQGWV